MEMNFRKNLIHSRSLSLILKDESPFFKDNYIQFKKKDKKLTKKVPKRQSSPPKTEVLHEQKCIFLLKKTTHPRKKLKFCMKKCQKIEKKIDQKNHPAPQKTRSFA